MGVFDCSDDFEGTLKKVLDEEKKSEIPTDGIVFTPIDSDYLPEGQKKEKEERFLSKNKDICKYKRPEDQGIDLLVKDDKVWCNGGVPFMGTPDEPFKYTLCGLDDIEGKIVEFKPDLEEGIYRPHRIRDDKLAPNSIQVALDNWKLQKDPILTSSLTGEDTKFFERYLKEVKSNIKKEMKNTNRIKYNQPLELSPKKKDLCILIFEINDPDYQEKINKLAKEFKKRRQGEKIYLYYFLPTSLRKAFVKGKKLDLWKRVSKNSYCDSDGKEFYFFEKPPSFRFEEETIPRTNMKLSSREKMLQSLYRASRGTFVNDEKPELEKRIFVSSKRVVQGQKGHKGVGDDEMERVEIIDPDIYRIGTLDEGDSLVHSLLKLLNPHYREANLSKRLKMGKSGESIKDYSLSQITQKFNHGITVYDSDGEKERYGKNSKRILLFRNKDGSYEPLVYKKNGKVELIFDEDSKFV
jgi:hypothetical protein